MPVDSSFIDVHHAVIHEIRVVKNEDKRDVDFGEDNLKQKTLPQSELLNHLVEKVSGLLAGKGNRIQHGRFIEKQEIPANFAFDFEQCYVQNVSNILTIDDTRFLQLSHNIMRRLQQAMRSKNTLTKSYILFADFSRVIDRTDVINSTRYFLIAMLNTTDNFILTDELQPNLIETLNLSNLHQAMRLNFNRYSEVLLSDSQEEEVEDKPKVYLNFLSARSETISGYFTEALALTEGVTSRKAVKILNKTLKHYFKNNERLKDESTLQNLERELLAFYESKEGKTVNTQDIKTLLTRCIPSSYSSEAESIVEDIISTLNSDDVGMPAEFVLTKSVSQSSTEVQVKNRVFSLRAKRNSISDTNDSVIYLNRAEKKIEIKVTDEDIANIDQEFIRLKGE